MKRAFWLCPILLFGVLAATSFGQEKPKTVEATKPDEQASNPVPLRVQVVFSEYDGEKKVVSLPYSFSVNANERRARPDTSIRDGVRAPFFTNKEQTQWNYYDVGTNIDCSAQSEGDGRYKLVLSVERSSISQEATAPVTRQFRAQMNPILRDGQTFESVMATDPVNGHVYRLTVTLNVPK